MHYLFKESEMKQLFSARAFRIANLILLVLTVFVTVMGVFAPSTYAAEVPSFRVQGMGQDAVTLAIVIPLGILGYLGARRGRAAGLAWYAGSLIYLAYSYIIYTFGTHFNRLFPAYTTILALSFYLSIAVLGRGATVEAGTPAGPRLRRWIYGFFIVVAAAFMLLWLSEIVPAVISGTVPASVTGGNFHTNSVHSVDLGIALPGLLITAVLVRRGKPLGNVLAPTVLVFAIQLTAAIVGMVVAMALAGEPLEPVITGMFALVIAAASVLLVLQSRSGAPRTGRAA